MKCILRSNLKGLAPISVVKFKHGQICTKLTGINRVAQHAPIQQKVKKILNQSKFYVKTS